MVSTYVILAILVVGIILMIYAFTTIFHTGAKSTTTTSTSTASSTSPSSVSPANALPAVVQFYDVNVQYVYTGPQYKNGVNCSYLTYTYIDGQSLTLNGSQLFNLQFRPTSTQCPTTITSVAVDTPGFTLQSTTPNLPFSLPPNSQMQLQINMRAPEVNFYGPLTITINFD